MYNKLLTATKNDLVSAVEYLEKWQSGDKVVTTVRSEAEIMEDINTAKNTKTYEEKVYGKFLRCRERYAQDPTKLSDSIVAYRRYLELRSQQYKNARAFANAATYRGSEY